MTDTVPATEPVVKTAADLKPGDWIIPGGSYSNTAAAISYVHLYLDSGVRRVMVVVSSSAGTPLTFARQASEKVTLATEEQISQAKTQARRNHICKDLDTIAGMFEDYRLPLPDGTLDTVTMLIRLDTPEHVTAVAHAIGAVPRTGGGQVDVTWPPGADPWYDGVRVRWYAFHPQTSDDATGLTYSDPDRLTDTPAGVVPAGVDVQALTSRAERSS